VEPISVSTIRCARLFTDADGESRFDEVEVSLVLSDFAPPAPPMDLSALVPASQFVFLQVPPGWIGDMHPSPRRQMGVVLNGRMEVTGAAGEQRVFGPGGFFLMEDTTGVGHSTRVVGDEDLRMAITALHDSQPVDA
jgi:hypothetical protein